MQKILILILLTVGLVGCSKGNGAEPVLKKTITQEVNNVAAKQTQQWRQVTVKYFDFEGVFYGLLTKNGDKLLPMNLDKKI